MAATGKRKGDAWTDILSKSLDHLLQETLEAVSQRKDVLKASGDEDVIGAIKELEKVIPEKIGKLLQLYRTSVTFELRGLTSGQRKRHETEKLGPDKVQAREEHPVAPQRKEASPASETVMGLSPIGRVNNVKCTPPNPATSTPAYGLKIPPGGQNAHIQAAAQQRKEVNDLGNDQVAQKRRCRNLPEQIQEVNKRSKIDGGRQNDIVYGKKDLGQQANGAVRRTRHSQRLTTATTVPQKNNIPDAHIQHEESLNADDKDKAREFATRKEEAVKYITKKWRISKERQNSKAAKIFEAHKSDFIKKFDTMLTLDLVRKHNFNCADIIKEIVDSVLDNIPRNDKETEKAINDLYKYLTSARGTLQKKGEELIDVFRGLTQTIVGIHD